MCAYLKLLGEDPYLSAFIQHRFPHKNSVQLGFHQHHVIMTPNSRGGREIAVTESAGHVIGIPTNDGLSDISAVKPQAP